ncbi:MAG: hypothetical protein HRU19_14490 [Pseudobacteriovorax sp.]|nr:hypothetical protein [Pseudobacteriovorax sp.]
MNDRNHPQLVGRTQSKKSLKFYLEDIPFIVGKARLKEQEVPIEEIYHVISDSKHCDLLIEGLSLYATPVEFQKYCRQLDLKLTLQSCLDRYRTQLGVVVKTPPFDSCAYIDSDLEIYSGETYHIGVNPNINLDFY